MCANYRFAACQPRQSARSTQAIFSRDLAAISNVHGSILLYLLLIAVGLAGGMFHG